jgi:diguanylate cyclase
LGKQKKALAKTMIRKILQFETMTDVVVRAVILVLGIAIAAGFMLDTISSHYFAESPSGFAHMAYIVGAFTGVVVGSPIVLAFFYAAKVIYGDHLEVAKIAREDFLTGLLNRREFFGMITRQNAEQGGQAFFTGEGLLLIIDADNFKRINDVHGHLIGDTALVAISTAIKKSVRDIDIVARIGGEEFGVFLPNVSNAKGLEIAERVRKSVADTMLYVGDERLGLNISIGAKPVTRTTIVSTSMKAADAALYAAKSQGKNRVVLADFAQELEHANSKQKVA